MTTRRPAETLPAATLDQACARMFGFGFEGFAITDDARSLLDRGCRATIFFARNVTSAQQFADLAAGVKRHANAPVLVGLDQEGGRVQRVRAPLTEIPSMRALGRTNDPELARQVGAVLGRELRAINVDIDFAPVLDIDTNPANPVIADRSLGSTPELVIRTALPLIEGLLSTGVAACGKHFPGHGDTSQDSHHDLPRLRHDLARLEAVELKPFAAAIASGIPSIMSSHVVFEPLDSVYPATMSHAALGGILRDRMGFDGVIFSDDMEMKAIATHFGVENAIVRGALAGIDCFWICHHPDLVHRSIDTLRKAVERGEIPEQRIRDANRRLDALVDRFAKPPTAFDPSLVGTADHQAIAQRVRDLAMEAAVAAGRDPTDFLKTR